mmetsp:Transcript_71128/g.166512  ORF Transcript_71128/g.166512 Transcript_71128/m.166512 type:complete len:357 (-) Transcript_71128:1201-2271(-)
MLKERTFGRQVAPDESHKLLCFRSPEVMAELICRRIAEELQLIPGTVLSLDVQRRAQASKLTTDLDRDAIAERLCLLHGVGRQDHSLVARAHADHLPEVPLGTGVHGCTRLVQEEQRRSADQGDGQAQFALHSATVLHGLSVGILSVEPQPVKEIVHSRIQLGLRDALDSTKEQQVFSAGQELPERINLRANAQDLVCLFQAMSRRDVVTEDLDLARCWRSHFASQDSQGGRFASTIGPEQPEALAVANTETDAPYGVGLDPLLLHFCPVDMVEALILRRILQGMVIILHPLLFGQDVVILSSLVVSLDLPGACGVAPKILEDEVAGEEGNYRQRTIERNGCGGRKVVQDRHLSVQ